MKSHSNRSSRCIVVLITIMTALSFLRSPAAHAEKTDIVYLKNGDTVTGEVLGLNQGEFRVDTRAMGIVKIKWAYVDSMASTKLTQIEVADGTRYLGTVNKGAMDKTIVVSGSSGIEVLDLNNIVYVQPINREYSLWKSMDKYLQLGFNFTKATDIVQWNLAAGVTRKEEHYQLSVDANSMVTNNGRGEDSARGDITTTYLRFLENRWFWFGTGSLEKNDELGIDNRILAGGGIGRFAWQTNSSELLVGAGLTANREKPIATMGNASNSSTGGEGLLYLDWTYYRASIPRSRLNAVFHMYPSLTVGGRYRANFDLRYRQEFVEDLYLSITWYSSYDSKPPESAVAKEDYGIVTSLEYHW